MAVITLILVTYSWLIVGALIFFLWRIAYFYEKTSKERVGHPFLIIPTVLLAAGVIWYINAGGRFVGEPVGDLLLFAGGLSLFLFGFRLQELMTGERK
jgi:hypothetical protein